MKSKIVELYEDGGEADRLQRSREAAVESLTTIRYLDKFINDKKAVIEIGCGTGHYPLHYANKCKSFHGVDLSEKNIDIFKKVIDKRKLKNVTAEVCDALDLKTIKDGKFDVVLNMGPLYHFDKKEQARSVQEAVRICKKGGVVAFSYMPKFGNFVRLCVNENFVGRYPTGELLDDMMNGEHDDDGVFFFSTPEKMEELVAGSGVKILHHLTTDGVTTQHHRIADYRDEEFDLWLKFHYMTCEERSMLGLGCHGLIIAKK